ncbi:hypothetical protein CEP53_015100, partial [Fusarium sp. AF-6]
MRGDYGNDLRIHHPANSPSDASAMFGLIHGGGFCLGNDFIHSYQLRAIASIHHVTVVNLSYHLTPEHRFPAGPNDRKPPGLPGVSACIPYFLEEGIVPAQYKDFYLVREQNVDSMVINKEAMDFVLAAYRPDIMSAAFSPFQSEHPHTGMPPVYM